MHESAPLEDFMDVPMLDTLAESMRLQWRLAVEQLLTVQGIDDASVQQWQQSLSSLTYPIAAADSHTEHYVPSSCIQGFMARARLGLDFALHALNRPGITPLARQHEVFDHLKSGFQHVELLYQYVAEPQHMERAYWYPHSEIFTEERLRRKYEEAHKQFVIAMGSRDIATIDAASCHAFLAFSQGRIFRERDFSSLIQEQAFAAQTEALGYVHESSDPHARIRNRLFHMEKTLVNPAVIIE